MLLPLEKNVEKFTAHPVTTVTLQEDSLNTYVKEKVAAVARKLGYIVATNRSSIITSTTDHYSRFATSKPDLYLYCPKHHCGFVVEKDYLLGMVTENKIRNSNLQAHLLGKIGRRLDVSTEMWNSSSTNKDLRPNYQLC